MTLKRIASAAVLLLGGILGARALLRPAILDTHTKFLFAQLDTAYSNSLKDGQQQPATTISGFIHRISPDKIDWNSCRFHDGTIFDAWGTAAEIRFAPHSIELRSAGPDRRFGTPDDIPHRISNPTGL